MMINDPCTALDKLTGHVERLKAHITEAHDALTECAIELIGLEEAGHIHFRNNREIFEAMTFQVAESDPDKLAEAADKLHTAVKVLLLCARMDEEILSPVLGLHTRLAGLKGATDA